MPGGADRSRTDDLRLARAALSQLSYSPIPVGRSKRPTVVVGLGRLELPTSRLSGVRSNQLSYRPSVAIQAFQPIPWKLNRGRSRIDLDCSDRRARTQRRPGISP